MWVPECVFTTSRINVIWRDGNTLGIVIDVALPEIAAFSFPGIPIWTLHTV